MAQGFSGTHPLVDNKLTTIKEKRLSFKEAQTFLYLIVEKHSHSKVEGDCVWYLAENCNADILLRVMQTGIFACII